MEKSEFKEIVESAIENHIDQEDGKKEKIEQSLTKTEMELHILKLKTIKNTIDCLVSLYSTDPNTKYNNQAIHYLEANEIKSRIYKLVGWEEEEKKPPVIQEEKRFVITNINGETIEINTLNLGYSEKISGISKLADLTIPFSEIATMKITQGSDDINLLVEIKLKNGCLERIEIRKKDRFNDLKSFTGSNFKNNINYTISIDKVKEISFEYSE